MRIHLGKRVLIVSSWAPPMVGGPQNLYNLFSQFSPDSYCILTRYEIIRRGNPIGTWLSGEYFFCDHNLQAQKSSVSTSHPSGTVALVNACRRVRRRISSLGSGVIILGFALDTLVTIAQMVRMGTRIARQKNIRCILGVSDTGPALIATYLISRFTGLPYSLYLFDIYLGNKLERPTEELLAKLFEPRLFKTAALVIVTNEGTEQFYRKRYGYKFKCCVIHNSVFPEAYKTKRTTYAPTKPYTIVFTGNVYWPQERSLRNLIGAVSQLQDLPVHLDLYVPNTNEAFKRIVGTCQNVQLTSASQSEMPDVQCRATILFLPLSWHTTPEVIATATPGKLADYLASGRPMLIHAPPYAYVNEYARQEGFALVVDQEDVEELGEGVRKLIFDVQYSRGLIENAKRTLYKNHDATANAQKLANILESL